MNKFGEYLRLLCVYIWIISLGIVPIFAWVAVDFTTGLQVFVGILPLPLIISVIAGYIKMIFNMSWDVLIILIVLGKREVSKKMEKFGRYLWIASLVGVWFFFVDGTNYYSEKNEVVNEPYIKCVFDIKNRDPYAVKKYDIINIFRNIDTMYFHSGDGLSDVGRGNYWNNIYASICIYAIPFVGVAIGWLFYGLCCLPIIFVRWIIEEISEIRNGKAILKDTSSESKIDKQIVARRYNKAVLKSIRRNKNKEQ